MLVTNLLHFLSTIEVDYIIFDKSPTDNSNNVVNVASTTTGSNTLVVVVVDDDDAKNKFQKDSKIFRGHLLNHMTNFLFDLFVTYKSAKKYEIM